MKLIIWDLDGILWSGTLTEGGIGDVNHLVIEFIKESESKGVVHSICSNNSLHAAKKQLEKLGIWELFVFPDIKFGPKGPRVKAIIESCQLRPTDVLFVDDNIINLNEASHFIPNLNLSIDTAFVQKFDIPNSKSRTNQYRILELKAADKDNVSFLIDSNINIALVENADCLLFSDRIVELANRSNVLNFSRTRFSSEEIISQLSAFMHDKMNFAIFAWDRYGYYGLIGYFSIEYSSNTMINRSWQMNHFVFSCRTLTMGIENFCAKYIQETLGYPCVWKYDAVDVQGNYDYITLHKFRDVENYIRSKEELRETSSPIAKIYAGCHSSVYWILTDKTHEIDYELSLVGNELAVAVSYEDVCKGTSSFDDCPNLMIYAAYFAYNVTEDDDATFECKLKYVEEFVDLVKKSNRKLLLLLPKIKDSDDLKSIQFDAAWRKTVDRQDVWELTIPKESYNWKTWTRSTMNTTTLQIVEWIDMLVPNTFKSHSLDE